MKLSEQGKERIYNHKMTYNYDCMDGEDAVGFYDLTECYEFERGDFEDAVIATPLEFYNLRASIWNAYGLLKADEPELALYHVKEASHRAAKIAKKSGCDYEPESLELCEEDKEVCFSLNEAERILECVNQCWQNSYDAKFVDEDRELAKMIDDRISYSKGKNGSE